MALKLISSLDMNDIKQEDVMLYDEGGQGNVSGAAVGCRRGHRIS